MGSFLLVLVFLPHFLHPPTIHLSLFLSLLPSSIFAHLPQHKQSGFDDNSHEDEAQCQHHGVDELPPEKEVADIEPGNSRHEETEDEGHGIGHTFGEFPDSLVLLFLFEVEVLFVFGV